MYNRRENETLIFVCTRVEEIAKSAFDVDGEAIGFHLASEGLVPYQDQEWKVDSESTIHRVQVKAERGLEGARKAERVMRDVRRELYSVCPACHLTVIIGCCGSVQVAAPTLKKDNSTVDLLLPDPVHHDARPSSILRC